MRRIKPITRRLEVVMRRLKVSRRGLERGGALGVFAFVIVKFVPVAGTLGSYGVNPWVFLALDVVTIWPYIKGISGLLRCMARHDPWLYCFWWGMLILISFILPYAYLYVAGGQKFPLIVHLTIGLVVVALALYAVYGIIKKKRSTIVGTPYVTK